MGTKFLHECTACWEQHVSAVEEVVLPKDREGEKSYVNWLWWTAAINQVVRLFIEKTAAGTRIINTVSVLCVNHKESIYSILLCSVLFFSIGRQYVLWQYTNMWQESLNPCCLAASPCKAMTLKKMWPASGYICIISLKLWANKVVYLKYHLLKMFSGVKIFSKEKKKTTPFSHMCSSLSGFH